VEAGGGGGGEMYCFSSWDGRVETGGSRRRDDDLWAEAPKREKIATSILGKEKSVHKMSAGFTL